MRRVGLYPGTFDPVTLGHLDVIHRARKLCDELIIGVASNLRKGPLFSIEERVEALRAEMTDGPRGELAEVRVEPFDKLLMHFAVEQGAHMIFRGLRAVSDFEYEFQMVTMNRALDREIETVFLMADAEHMAIASRFVKEIASLGGDVSKFVTPRVKAALNERFES